VERQYLDLLIEMNTVQSKSVVEWWICHAVERDDGKAIIVMAVIVEAIVYFTVEPVNDLHAKVFLWIWSLGLLR
jgi:hypothetical protein